MVTIRERQYRNIRYDVLPPASRKEPAISKRFTLTLQNIEKRYMVVIAYSSGCIVSFHQDTEEKAVAEAESQIDSTLYQQMANSGIHPDIAVEVVDADYWDGN